MKDTIIVLLSVCLGFLIGFVMQETFILQEYCESKGMNHISAGKKDVCYKGNTIIVIDWKKIK